MKRIIATFVFALVLPGAVLAATKTYDTAAFEAISVGSGIDVDIVVGPTRSVVAETTGDDFDDLKVSVEGNELRIGRPSSSWFSGMRSHYKVRVVTPALRSLDVSSGSDVEARGIAATEFSIEASSGSDVDIAGTCVSLEANASSGSDLDAEDLKCENVKVRASSGSDVSVHATKQLSGHASSGSDVKVRGKPPIVNLDKSSGADVTIKD